MCNSYIAIIVIVIILFSYIEEKTIYKKTEIYKQKQYDYVKTGSDL